ncbi:redox-sensing transcriptional repressor Rex [Clostridium cochlearium]|jgi:redox-sensing transcriptional repressor|uniref:Redox-sensing transcriptional repressor Rex n=1 Tax=Clostridium cochlearium TaxID=1494 RepID=A0ABY0QIQ8_CLOCO|nr:redox-sensing transcriptional repressor Rex [Clostridium cochlearium]MBE6065207.1 redox-sensing transcriptional repressor Rex [Clostridium cochlearium]MDU1442699.1 redox-sensing transcriptional repressor Rex [Clostridium cochlearium]NMA57430.1 redox-sensing transcriptional repressor Rex [Clostridium cochlearium]NME95771.1 redox-sensing transcriptional repressor Rex [Clostridium cochlearium]SDK89951.1 redox-sensing transcriptional repressor [Clostridium cochlearium]
MDKKRNISMAVIKRLPKYHRYLEELLKNEVDRISSKELSKKIGFTASQIRQDFNCFGDFGQQGYGYNVKELHAQISNILGLTKEYKCIILGGGNIGQAVANYNKFEKLGFKLESIFDINPKLVGLKIRDIEIKDIDTLEDYLKENNIDVGIICVPSRSAQKVCDILTRNNVKGIWNFAPVDLKVPEEVFVENVHLSESLLTLSYLMNEQEG